MSRPETLVERMHSLFDDDENIKEWILIGKLPGDIAEIAAEAMECEESKRPKVGLLDPQPGHFVYLGEIIQRTFFPDAPPLARGKGKAPSWTVILQSAAQIAAVARSRGFEIPEAR